METLQLLETNINFSSILKYVEAGNEFAIADKNKQPIAIVIPYNKWKQNTKRQLGTLENKMSVVFSDDFTL
jgi:antitoxin (DNA-binding transcriptional repressor) of toxin-antitoxin stability system